MKARFQYNVELIVDGKKLYGVAWGYDQLDAIENVLWMNPQASSARIV